MKHDKQSVEERRNLVNKLLRVDQNTETMMSILIKNGFSPSAANSAAKHFRMRNKVYKPLSRFEKTKMLAEKSGVEVKVDECILYFAMRDGDVTLKKLKKSHKR